MEIKIFAQTSRITGDGHRFIQSSGNPPGSSLVYKYFGDLQSANWKDNWAMGNDWLAIRRQVVQDESSRVAFDTLMLSGINLACCNSGQIDLMKAFLSEKMKEFSENLIPRQPWTEDKRSLVLTSDQLSAWEQDVRIINLPLLSPITSQIYLIHNSNIKRLFLFLLMVVGLFFSFHAFFVSRPPDGQHQQLKGDKSIHSLSLFDKMKELFSSDTQVDETTAAFASISRSLGISVDEFAKNILIEEGLLGSVTAEGPGISTVSLLRQNTTLSEPLLKDSTSYSYTSSDYSRTCLSDLLGSDSTQLQMALKYRKFLYDFANAWNKVIQIHEKLKIPDDLKPLVFKEIFHNNSLFIEPFPSTYIQPLTPFFRKNDTLFARKLQMIFFENMKPPFLFLLNIEDKDQLDWISRFRKMPTLGNLADLLCSGLLEQIENNLKADEKLRTVHQKIGEFREDPTKCNIWKDYASQIENANEVFLEVLKTIMDLSKER